MVVVRIVVKLGRSYQGVRSLGAEARAGQWFVVVAQVPDGVVNMYVCGWKCG